MKMQATLVENLISDYRKELANLYPEAEIMQILYMLFWEYLGWTKTTVHLSYAMEISGSEKRAFENALKNLSAGKPIQYIIGWTLFNGSRISVNSGVLIPRPETEELCLLIKKDLVTAADKNLSVLDVGTGSGCILIDLKKHFPGFRFTAIDSSDAAIKTAHTNARENSTEISFIQADILNHHDCAKLGMFDVIISNPPYVLESEKQQMHQNVIGFEPPGALFVTDRNPLQYYYVITSFARDHLREEGMIYFEINEKFGKEVSDLLREMGFKRVEILNDFHGKERFVRARQDTGNSTGIKNTPELT